MLVLHLCISEFFVVTWNVILRPLQWFSDVPHVSTIRLVGSEFFSALISQSIICISLDRLLAAGLTLKYKVIVTKQKLTFTVIVLWLLAFICALISAIDSTKSTIIWLFWSSTTITSIVLSYSYISVVLFKQNQKMRRKTSTSTQHQFNYRIPLCITLSYVLAMFIPDIVVVADKSLFTVWTLVIWYTNFLVDPLIYVFFRFSHKRTKRHLFASKVFPNG